MSAAPFATGELPSRTILAFSLTYYWDAGGLEWVEGTQPTAGVGTGLTDAELRATPVPVSGTVAVTGPLTDVQLRATPVPVLGGLTDSELRATPVPVSGTVVANPTGYITRLDEASATITYVGQASPGTATAAASWSIKRLDSTSGLVVLYAAGTAAFNQVWDNRSILAYS